MMRRTLSTIVAFLCLSFVWGAGALSADLRFHQINPKLFPSNYVKSLYQDSDGYVWVATSNGLVRYDGQDADSFTEYLDEYSFLYEVIQNGDSGLILATDKGLLSLDLSSGKTRTLIQGGSVSSIVQDKDRNIWAGGEDGLFCMPCGDEAFREISIHIDGHPVKGIIDVLADKDGNVWLTTWQKGLYVYSPVTGQTKVFKNGLLAYSYVLHQDDTGYILVGTWGHGLLRLDHDFMETSAYETYPTYSPQGDILYDEVIYAINDIDGKILIGGQKGLSVMDPESSECIFYSPGSEPGALPYNQVNSILVTENRNVYLGLYGGGMCSLEFHQTPYYIDRMDLMRRRLGTTTIHSICDAGNGAWWMGVADNAFVLYDPLSGTMTKYNEIDGLEGLASISTAFAIRKRTSSGEFCFGTYSEGLWIYDALKHRVRVYSTQTCDKMLNHNILALENDLSGNLWIGTHNGVYVLTPDNDLLSLYDLIPCDMAQQLNDQISGIAASKDGKVYLATVHSGIIEVDQAHGRVLSHLFEGKQVPFSNILVDEGGHVWAGTINDGLYVLDQSEQSLKKVELIKGLDSQSVTNLVQSSDGEIWLTTSNEIISFRCLGGGAADVTRYISAIEVDICSNTGVFAGQMLLLGTTDGVLGLELDSLSQIPFYSSNLVVTDIILNGVSYNDKNINALDKLCVHEGDNVEIRYTLLDYNSPMSPIYTCSYGDVRYETAENSIAFTVREPETLVSISNELSGESRQILVVAEDDSHAWIYFTVAGVMVLVAAGLFWRARRAKSRKESDKDVISFEINSIKFESADQQLLSQAMEVIHRNISNSDFKQDDFIREMGMSRTLLTDKLKELTGFTPISLILEVRLKTAYNTIMEAKDKLRVSDVAYSVGFNDAKYFSTCFRKRYGMTPKDLMKKKTDA